MVAMDIQLIDWLIVVLYLVAVFAIAISTGRHTVTNDNSKAEDIAREKYLANNSLTFWESICSIIGTEVSALTFLGIPAFAFKNNFSFIQIYFGAILGRFIIAKVFLPRVYNKGLTIYEVMAKETGLPSGQRTVALFYSVSKIFSVGVRVFSGSIMVSQFMGVSIYVGLTSVVFITFLYTLVGGLKAVVKTDILQMSLFIVGGLLAHYLIPKESGQSWSELMGMAHAAGKTTFFSLDNPWPFVFGIMGGVLFDMSTHGVDQDFAQRLTANESLKHGQMAIFFSSFVSISVGLLFLGVGALLWAFYQGRPLPAEVPNSDHLFSYFIIHYFPAGFRGVMVAGVVAATMSVLDSTINALCATLYNDVFPKRQAQDIKFYSIIDNIVVTLLILAVAMAATQFDGLLMLGLKIQSWTGGALLGLFMTKVVFQKWFRYRLTPMSVIGAYACGMSGVYVNTQILQWDWNLNVYWGCILSMLFLKAYSTVRPIRPMTA